MGIIYFIIQNNGVQMKIRYSKILFFIGNIKGREEWKFGFMRWPKIIAALKALEK